MSQAFIQPPLTFEQAMALLEKQHQDTLAKIEADRFETFAKIEADKKLHQEQMKEFKEKMEKHDKRMENLSRRFGDLGNRLGEIVECLVSPGLKEKFDKYGFYFRNTTVRHEITDESRNVITDIDVLLQDGDDVMAVEVKTKPTTSDVERHIKRMEQIQQYAPGLTANKRVYGAIAGAIIDKDVLDAAFEAGFYVISQTGDNVDIIEPPSYFVPKYWDVVPK